jgi:hypothetical protein
MMKAPSYRKRLMLLDEILSDGMTLFKMLHESEELLRKQLVKGDYQALIDAEEKRTLIQSQINALEERRKALVPEGTGLQKYIRTTIGKSSQAELLGKLAEIIEELKSIRVIHEVNRSLLRERLRFTRELQERLLVDRMTYDKRGQLKDENRNSIKNLDTNC